MRRGTRAARGWPRSGRRARRRGPETSPHPRPPAQERRPPGIPTPKAAGKGGWGPASHGPAPLRHPEGREYKVTFWTPRLIDAEIEVSVYHAAAGRRPITRRRRITVYVSAT